MNGADPKGSSSTVSGVRPSVLVDVGVVVEIPEGVDNATGCWLIRAGTGPPPPGGVATDFDRPVKQAMGLL